MNNSIYLRRRNKIYLEKGNNVLPKTYISTLLKNIECLGYTLTSELIEIISTFSIDQLEEFYKQIIDDLKTMLGANAEFKPMYPNFPKQVMEMPEAELYFNAAMHYFGDWIGERILPVYKKTEREELKDKIKFKIIELGNKDNFEQIFTMLLKSKTSISETDKIDLEWFVKNYQSDVLELIPDEIPLKENVALLGYYLLKFTEIGETVLKKHIKTATDILRLATAMSDGDISLAENTKFKNFSKKHRRLILSSLENCNNITEDMLHYKEKWKRLGERLHPFEYKNKFQKCFASFDILRNDKLFQTFNSKIESSLIAKDIDLTVTLLKDRPGEFARRLDNLVRLAENKSLVLETFENIANNVSSPLLLQVLTHFKNRNNIKELRTFFPKGNVAKVKAIKDKLPKIDEEICNQIVIICENKLIEKFKKLKPLNNVYLDEQLKDFKVPFALRSASKSLKTISRGSKLDLPEGNTIRFFIWWKDGQERTDLDLSAVGLDENYNHKVDIAYYNLKGLGAFHSGDITSAPSGASEFIDIDISEFLKEHIRFIVMSVNSFTSQPFRDLPECFAGFMIRQFANSGEIYDPKTVENKFDLTSDTQVSIPLIIDLLERKVFWTDIALKHNLSYNNNVYNNMSSITIMAKSMTTLVKPNLYDLFVLHVKARGTLTNDIENADTIFAKDKGIKPTDIEKIISEFL